MKKVAIMQPYFLPYIGYWQLISSVDEFVIYDNIEYTKKGWFNRNRILVNNTDSLFTIPIKKDSDYLDVRERSVSDDASREINKILRVIEASYKKAPYYDEVYPLIEKCFLYPDKNLFNYIYNSVKLVCDFLNIDTKIIVSSDLNVDHKLRAENRVKAIVKAVNGNLYINAIGGVALYNKDDFSSQGLELKFLKPELLPYRQTGSDFIPGLSIIDVLMFNDKNRVLEMLQNYTLE